MNQGFCWLTWCDGGPVGRSLLTWSSTLGTLKTSCQLDNFTRLSEELYSWSLEISPEAQGTDTAVIPAEPPSAEMLEKLAKEIFIASVGRWVEQGSFFFFWQDPEMAKKALNRTAPWAQSDGCESLFFWVEVWQNGKSIGWEFHFLPEASWKITRCFPLSTLSHFFSGAFGSKKKSFFMGFPAYLSSGGVPASGGSVSWRSHGLKMEDRRCRRPDVDVEHNGMVKDRRNFSKSHGTFTRSHATIYRLIFIYSMNIHPHVHIWISGKNWIYLARTFFGKLCRMTMWWKWKRRLVKMISNGKKCASFRNNFNAWSIAYAEEDQMRLWITTGREQVFDVASPKINGAKYDLVFADLLYFLCECMAKSEVIHLFGAAVCWCKRGCDLLDNIAFLV